jgi:hypothetical protein
MYAMENGMTLPSIVDGTQKHYEAQRRQSEAAYALTAGVPERESRLARIWRRLRSTSLPETQIRGAAKSGVRRPPAFSK